MRKNSVVIPLETKGILLVVFNSYINLFFSMSDNTVNQPLYG